VYTRKNVREEEERVTMVATFGLCSSGGSKLRMTKGRANSCVVRNRYWPMSCLREGWYCGFLREDQGLKMIAFFFVWLMASFVKIGLGCWLMLADDMV
jgi:hypothetical protein